MTLMQSSKVLTLFTDQTVITVVGVVGVSKAAMGILKFEKFVAMFA
jgi:hypothetical protein